MAIRKSFLLFSLFTLLGLVSCNPLSDVDRTINNGVEELNDALYRLDQTSDSWQNVLAETRDVLIDRGLPALANEVSGVIRQTTSDIGVETRCTADFFKDRAREEIINLRSTITKEKLKLVPVICQPNPDTIDFDRGNPNIIKITGYNLSKDSVNLYLQESYNGEKKIVNHSLDHPSKYSMTIILSKINNLKNSHNLRLELANGGGVQTIGIQKKAARFEKRYISGKVRVTGRVDLRDDEVFGDETGSAVINETITITPNKSGVFKWNKCVGDEVHGYLDSSMRLNPINGHISIQGTSDYYEGTKCGRTERQKDDTFSHVLKEPQQSEYPYQKRLADSEGAVRFDLNFKYLSVQTKKVKVE